MKGKEMLLTIAKGVTIFLIIAALIYAGNNISELTVVKLYKCNFDSGVYYLTNYTIELKENYVVVKGYNETLPHYLSEFVGRPFYMSRFPEEFIKIVRKGDPFYLIVLDECEMEEIVKKKIPIEEREERIRMVRNMFNIISNYDAIFNVNSWEIPPTWIITTPKLEPRFIVRDDFPG